MNKLHFHGIGITAFAVASCILSELRTADSEVFVVGVMVVSNPACEAETSPNATLVGQGVLDLTLAQGYVAAVLVGNQLVDRGSPERLNAELGVTLSEVSIEVIWPDGSSKRVRTVASAFLNAPTDEGASYASLWVPLLSEQTLSDHDFGNTGTALVTMRALGETLGGKRVESNEFTFPIFLCEGCLIDYPPEALDPSTPSGTYLCGVESADTREEQPCFPGQDVRISCSVCSSTLPVCRDPALNPWNI